MAKKHSFRFIFVSENISNQNLKEELMFVCSKIDLSDVLPRVKAFIHTGGIGSSSHALKFGIPQLALPFGHDQFTNAATIDNLGVGKFINFRSLNIKNFEEILKKIISSASIKKSCIENQIRLKTSISVENMISKIELDKISLK
jgi:UDP:flavonoid glycosyltransferase YjiC (YdhE family)